MPAAPVILTVNAGSSSLKLRLLGPADEILAERDADPEGLRDELLALLESSPRPDAAAHRVVHGGALHRPTLVDPSVEAELERLADLAPLHNPQAVRAMQTVEEVRPGLANVACFDTSFHADLPLAARTYALPAEWDAGDVPLRRYGFHGLSHAYASRRAAQLLGRPLEELRLVTAHLGAGASLAAVAGGRSVDTTMGFTPLEGLMMATRAGSVDPGLLLWLQRHRGIGPEEMERALDRESGLLGLTGTADMREVVAGASRGEEAMALALNVYIHRLAASIAAMAAALGGLDALVFTGGVGENAPLVRERACAAAGFLGVALDPASNAAGRADTVISPPGAAAAVLLVAAREDVEMARQARAALAGRGASRPHARLRPRTDIGRARRAYLGPRRADERSETVSDKDSNGAPRRLLVGYDASDGAKDAVELCRVIAGEDAHVAVVDVLPYPGAPSNSFRVLDGSEFVTPEDYFEPATSRLPGREVETITYLGDSPARVFEAFADSERLEMIVVGSPHHGTLGRLLAGSVAEALLHGAPVPVATAPHGYAGESHDGLKTIAVAYDGGEESREALAYAQAIARAHGAGLDVLTVERPVNPVAGAIALTMSLPENVEEIQRQALHEVDPEIDLRRRRLNGETAEAIIDACREGVDLLVVGSRGYGTVERVLLGSTSTALVRAATCPVVVVPRPAEHGHERHGTSGVMIGDQIDTTTTPGP